jgi:glutamyl-tRNA reductase
MVQAARPIPILMIGLNHKAAPVEVRERLAFGPERSTFALRELLGEGDADGRSIHEAVLLSTCNRTEVYIHANLLEPAQDNAQPASSPAAIMPGEGSGQGNLAKAESKLHAFFARHAGLPVEELERIEYILRGEDAAHHLMQVSAGLDSLILGENEILGQVRSAAEIAQAAGTTGTLLSALFRYAVQTGKRVRHETEIGRADISVASVVVEQAEEVFGPLKDRTALLIGAGKISSITARALVKAGLRCVMIANRTYEKAQKLAQRLNGVAVHFDVLEEMLPKADIVICSTGAPHIVLHADSVSKAQALRQGRPLLIADLAVPRDADPQIASIPGVKLTNIDDLGSMAKTCNPLTASVCQAAEEIVRQELAEFCRWYDARRFAPLIEALFQKAEAISEAEVEQTLRRLGSLTPHQERLVKALGRSIVGKLLHEPAACLRELPPGEDLSVYAEVIQNLYGI